jgi:hypothetical protein
VQARAVLQAFGTIHHETLQKRILVRDEKPRNINALRDNHRRRAEIVPMGTMGAAIPLRTPTAAATRVADAVI